MSDIYSKLAEYYDILGEHIDYKSYAGFANEICREHGEGKSGIALDLACGTGSISVELAKLGYDVIGVDLSSDMLDEARRKKGSEGILYICQDMRQLDLYGTVDLCVCALDSLNYLTKPSELQKVLALVHNFLEPGGIFVFDLNSRRKFEEVYGYNSYIFDEDDVFCSWQNFYDGKTGICDFVLSLFSKEADGRYEREDEFHKEKYYSRKKIESMLKKVGFSIIGVYSELDIKSPSNDDEYRTFYAVKAVK